MHVNYLEQLTEFERLSMSIPTEKDTAELVSSLDSIATETGVVLTEIVTGDRTVNRRSSGKAESVMFMILNIKIEGDYSSIKNFVGTLEKNIRLININEFTIGRKSGGAQSGILVADIKSDAYRVK